MTLAHAAVGQPVTVKHVGGDRAFRRRLMELGLVPGTPVELVGVAPLGDPLELLVRGCSLSIRKGEALFVSVVRAAHDAACVRTQVAPNGHEAEECGSTCGAIACSSQGSV